MKRIISTLLIVTLVVGASAQTEFDVLKYIQPDISGTARYSSMAGAFGALGGDPSAIKDNPAGLGIYRSSEFSASFNALNQSATSNWGKSATDGLFKLGVNNFTFVISSPLSTKNSAGLIHSNWSFSYNRLKDYNRNLKINGGNNATSSVSDYMAYFTGNTYGENLYDVADYNPYNNTTVSWISVLAANGGLMNEFVNTSNETTHWDSMLDDGETVSPIYYLTETGYFNQYALSWSGNFNNRLFLGATVNFHDINYNMVSENTEAFQNTGSIGIKNVLKQTGNGIGLRLGTIYAPLDYLRIGASLQTPVIYTISDIHYADLMYNYSTTTKGKILTPEGTDEFYIQSPFIYNLSASFIFGKKGVLGVEYINSQNTGAKLIDSENRNAFDEANESMSELFNNQHTVKIGGEYKLNANISLRAGYAYTGPSNSALLGKEMNSNTTRTDMEYFIHNNTQYYSGGVGYRGTNWYVDLGVINRVVDENFFPYNTKNMNANLKTANASVINSNLNVVATIGFKL